MIPASFRGRAAVLFALAVLLAAPAPALAQEEPAPRSFCLAGRPAPTCRAFLVAQGSFFAPVAGTPHAEGLEGHGELEVGMMVNRGRSDAVGGAVQVGADANGLRLALKGRYRRWLGRYAAFDAGAGVLHARRNLANGSRYDEPGLGVTGDVSIGLTDWAMVSARGDVLWSGEASPAWAGYGGVRLGTAPGVVVGVVLLVVASAVAGAS